jgi:glycosyltransferase involved in cell wall biosynthesis
MKIAIIHDDLMRRGGGEQVAICFKKAFPSASIYTSVYQPELTYPEFKDAVIYTSWFQKMVRTEKWMKRLFFPFGLTAMKSFKLKEKYDVVLISTTYSGKYIKIPKDTLVITYCYTPFRLAWNPNSYSEYLNSNGIKRYVFDIVIRILKRVDFKSSQRTNYFLAMTEETKQRIFNAYRPKKEIKIIPPPVNIANFKNSNIKGDYFLLVSRMEHYKRVDLAIDAFNKIGEKLIIVGRGSKKEDLRKRANNNITFLEGIDSDRLCKLYEECRAFIFPQHEDYGITPLEANASGKIVVAYGAGGVLETMIPYTGDPESCTSIFFKIQEPGSIIEAISLFEKLEDKFDSEFIRRNAEKYNEDRFISEVQNFVKEKFEANVK